MEVVIFGRYDLNFVLLDGILAVCLDPTFIKKLLDFSAMVSLQKFWKVIIGHIRFVNYNLHDHPCVFSLS